MKWHIDFSRESIVFLKNNNLYESVILEQIKFALRKFSGEDINVNIKKLKGKWDRFYRIRNGKLRIIAKFNFDNFCVYIDRIDWRGNIYK